MRFFGAVVPQNTNYVSTNLRLVKGDMNGTEAIKSFIVTPYSNNNADPNSINTASIYDIGFVRINGSLERSGFVYGVSVEVHSKDLDEIIILVPELQPLAKMAAGVAICVSYLILSCRSSGVYIATYDYINENIESINWTDSIVAAKNILRFRTSNLEPNIKAGIV